jgi:ABC-type Fe3+-hydroxamate transport system substrate-binding protein
VDDALDGLRQLATLVAADVGLAEQWRDRSRAATNSVVRAPVRYFCPIWRGPYMTARRDTYMADLLARAGGIDAAPTDGPLHYNAVPLADAMAALPEIILLPDEPYRFAARHIADFAPFADVPVVANGRIVLFDGKLLTWYGPRTPAALAFFAETFARVRAEAEVAAHG